MKQALSMIRFISILLVSACMCMPYIASADDSAANKVTVDEEAEPECD